MSKPVIRMSVRLLVFASLFTFMLMGALTLSVSAASIHTTKATTHVQTIKDSPPKGVKCKQGWKSKTEHGKKVWYCGNKKY